MPRKIKHPFRVTSVASLPEPGTVCVVSANGTIIHMTAADLVYLNEAADTRDARFQLSDLMGQDIRLLRALRFARLNATE